MTILKVNEICFEETAGVLRMVMMRCKEAVIVLGGKFFSEQKSTMGFLYDSKRKKQHDNFYELV